MLQEAPTKSFISRIILKTSLRNYIIESESLENIRNDYLFGTQLNYTSVKTDGINIILVLLGSIG